MSKTPFRPTPPTNIPPAGSLGGLTVGQSSERGTRLPVCIPVVSDFRGTHYLSYPRGWLNPLKYVVVPLYMDGRPVDIFANFCATVDDFGNLVKVSTR